MGQGMLGLLIEGMVSLLLVATIFYCINLSRKLERLRREQTEMRTYIGELLAATGNAEKAIRSLRTAADEAGGELAEKIAQSQRMSASLENEIKMAANTMNKLMVMTQSASERLAAAPLSAPHANAPAVQPSAVVKKLREAVIGFDEVENLTAVKGGAK